MMATLVASAPWVGSISRAQQPGNSETLSHRGRAFSPAYLPIKQHRVVMTCCWIMTAIIRVMWLARFSHWFYGLQRINIILHISSLDQDQNLRYNFFLNFYFEILITPFPCLFPHSKPSPDPPFPFLSNSWPLLFIVFLYICLCLCVCVYSCSVCMMSLIKSEFLLCLSFFCVINKGKKSHPLILLKTVARGFLCLEFGRWWIRTKFYCIHVLFFGFVEDYWFI